MCDKMHIFNNVQQEKRRKKHQSKLN